MKKIVIVSENNIIKDSVEKYFCNEIIKISSQQELNNYCAEVKKIDILIVDIENIQITKYNKIIQNIINLSPKTLNHVRFSIVKPFSIATLFDAIRTLENEKSFFRIINNNFIYNEYESYIYDITLEKEQTLTSKENQIIKFLLLQNGFKCRKEDLFQSVWSEVFVEPSVIETYIYKLKTKTFDLLKYEGGFVMVYVNEIR